MSINLRYDQQPSFDPVKNGIAFDQNKYPIILTEAELKALSPKHVLPVCEGRMQTLSEVLKIPLFHLDPVIAAIDEKFHEAMREYKESLNKALGDDLKTIERLEREKQTEVTTQTSFWATVGGAGGVILVGTFSAAVFIASSLGLVSYLFASEKKAEFIKSQGMTFRKAWLHKVECLEAKRMEEAQGLLKNRADALYEHLKSQKEISIINTQEWTYLGQVLKALQHLNVEKSPKLKKIQNLYQNLSRQYPALEKMED